MLRREAKGQKPLLSRDISCVYEGGTWQRRFIGEEPAFRDPDAFMEEFVASHL
jgi:hypothetical protein